MLFGKIDLHRKKYMYTGLRRAVGKVSVSRCESVTTDPGVASSISAWSHTFMEIVYEIISTVILVSSAESFKKDCSQLERKVCA